MTERERDTSFVLLQQRVRDRRVQLILVYLAGGSLWIYAVVDRRGDVGDLWQLILLYAGHILLGAAAGRWWVLPLPLLLVPIAVPAGHIPTAGDVDSAYEIALLSVPAFMVALAIGVVLPRLASRLVLRR